MSEPQLFEDFNDLEAPPFAHPGSALDGMLNATPDRGFQPPHDSPLSSWNRDRATPSRSAPGALHKHANPLRSRVHMRLDMSGAGKCRWGRDLGGAACGQQQPGLLVREGLHEATSML